MSAAAATATKAPLQRVARRLVRFAAAQLQVPKPAAGKRIRIPAVNREQLLAHMRETPANRPYRANDLIPAIAEITKDTPNAEKCLEHTTSMFLRDWTLKVANSTVKPELVAANTKDSHNYNRVAKFDSSRALRELLRAAHTIGGLPRALKLAEELSKHGVQLSLSCSSALINLAAEANDPAAALKIALLTTRETPAGPLPAAAIHSVTYRHLARLARKTNNLALAQHLWSVRDKIFPKQSPFESHHNPQNLWIVFVAHGDLKTAQEILKQWPTPTFAKLAAIAPKIESGETPVSKQGLAELLQFSQSAELPIDKSAAHSVWTGIERIAARLNKSSDFDSIFDSPEQKEKITVDFDIGLARGRKGESTKKL